MSPAIFRNISQFSNVDDYLPLFNAVLLTDIGVILLMLFGWIESRVLRQWYDQYSLSAVIADVLIILIGIVLARFLYPFLFNSWSLWKFIVLAVGIQIVHDLLFYVFFRQVPRGLNRMLDTFKNYANEAGIKAVLADSVMMISACLLGSFFKGMGTNANVILMIVLVYLIPYLIYA